MTTNFYHTSACRVQHCYSISICPVECWYYVRIVVHIQLFHRLTDIILVFSATPATPPAWVLNAWDVENLRTLAKIAIYSGNSMR